jgi:lipopolysaccharide biosynthesis glycosyltransferase
MKELAVAYMNAGSMYMANKSKSQYQLQREAVEQVADSHFADMELFGVKYEDWKNLFCNNGRITPTDRKMREDFNLAFKDLVEKGVLK